MRPSHSYQVVQRLYWIVVRCALSHAYQKSTTTVFFLTLSGKLAITQVLSLEGAEAPCPGREGIHDCPLAPWSVLPDKDGTDPCQQVLLGLLGLENLRLNVDAKGKRLTSYLPPRLFLLALAPDVHTV